nr:alkaline phosphatase PhoX [Parvularcula maris]
MLQGSLATAAAGFLVPNVIGKAEAQGFGRNQDLIDFKTVSLAEAQTDLASPSISDDYEYQVLIPWGTPIEPGIVREFDGDPNNRPTSAEAPLQVGIGHDGMWYFPLDDQGRGRGSSFRRNLFSSNEGMLCVNHEFGQTSTVLGKVVPESLDDVRIMQAVHGVSVVKIERAGNGRWDVAASKNARRITVNTPVAFSGPVAGSEQLDNENGNIPLGTVNNCGSGPTPWGTYLTCEENFNGYFGVQGSINGSDTVPQPETFSFRDALSVQGLDRYGFDNDGFNYYWHEFDGRFDLSDEEYANEHKRFGWIVEIDPMNARQVPTKRTAMGRFKHEAVAIGTSRRGRAVPFGTDGQVVAYMGDDERFDYCYRFVSDETSWQRAIAQGRNPLDFGKLFVAKFFEPAEGSLEGRGEWLEITRNDPLLAAAFKDDAEMLVFTRIAADILGATPMDRPEWTTIGARNGWPDGSVYWTLTNNSRRDGGTGFRPGVSPSGGQSFNLGAEGPNTEVDNPDGYILKTTDDGRGYTGKGFSWEVFILASSTRDTENVFTDPDAAYADPFGRLFIGTDGGQPNGINNQLVVFDTTKPDAEPQRLFTGVDGDEITGWATTPDYRTAFTNSQHPGNGDPSVTNFPAPRDNFTIPRDCTVVIRRKDGGVVGS